MGYTIRHDDGLLMIFPYVWGHRSAGSPPSFCVFTKRYTSAIYVCFFLSMLIFSTLLNNGHCIGWFRYGCYTRDVQLRLGHGLCLYSVLRNTTCVYFSWCSAKMLGGIVERW